MLTPPSQDILNDNKLLFERTTKLIATKLLEKDERTGVSSLEALMAGVSNSIERLEGLQSDHLHSLLTQLKEDPSLASEYLRNGVTSKEKVDARIQAAVRIFSE